MTSRIFLYSYNYASAGAKALAKGLGVKRIKHQSSSFRGRPNKKVINWGATQVPPEVTQCEVINSPVRVNFVANKLNFFRMAGKYSRVPGWTDDPDVARKMVEKGKVCARTVLNGHSGNGLVVISNQEEFVPAPLYTQYIPKMSEFRVHIFRGEVIDVQRKARRLDTPDNSVNWEVRSHQNGFVYIRSGVNPPRDVINQSLAAFSWTKLDFGAVDVIFNMKKRRAYVLEINTAPGLEGTTLERYTEAMKGIV